MHTIFCWNFDVLEDALHRRWDLITMAIYLSSMGKIKIIPVEYFWLGIMYKVFNKMLV